MLQTQHRLFYSAALAQSNKWHLRDTIQIKLDTEEYSESDLGACSTFDKFRNKRKSCS